MTAKPAFTSVLIANRGEIAIRIAHAAAELGLRTVAVWSSDDAGSRHRLVASESVALQASGPAAYLDGEAIIRAALDSGCQAVHPGYGFLSENAAFAQRCAQAGLVFIGPEPRLLALFGDKSRARDFAREHQVPVTDGTQGPTTLEQARLFMSACGDGAVVVIKAIAGGGGRGMRVVRHPDELADAHARCRSEARTAFGNPDVYVERFVPSARHIEVQVIGDGTLVIHLGERDCSVQRRNQKIIEIAPSPWLAPALRERIIEAALTLARQARYTSLGTFEFLVDGRGLTAEPAFVFIEANPRLQVEHTVTEEVTGIDLVKTQIALARGQSLAQLNLHSHAPSPQAGYAIQFRVNMETLPGAAGEPDDGCLHRFEPPGGVGVRVDSFGYAGFTPSRNFDALLAKLIVANRSPDFADTLDRGYRALCEFGIDGVATNLRLLRNLARDPAFKAGEVITTYVDEHLARLCAEPADAHPNRLVALALAPARADGGMSGSGPSNSGQPGGGAGFGTGAADQPAGAVPAPLRGSVLEVSVAVGDQVDAGQPVAVLEAMKMEHLVLAPAGGRVSALLVAPGELMMPGQPMLLIDIDEHAGRVVAQVQASNDTSPNAALRESIRLHDLTLDAARPAAVKRRHGNGMRTARENIDDLCDAGSFFEYGALAVAARRREHSVETLREISPADGFICGMATVNADLFGAQGGRCFVASYDYSVFAGTQGFIGHKKHDRLFMVAEDARAPVVLFCEGGGGRPTDSDNLAGGNLANTTFALFARLSGLVPLVGVVAGRCFAGNAALLGCCDVIIATENASIGMGGPVMIEGAGLGVVKPDAVGPAAMHARNGVVDLLVRDEAQAVAAAKRYLAYFQGPLANWRAHDQLPMRNAIPERRTRAYDIRTVIDRLADIDSVMELRRGFGASLITALARIEGRTIGILANDPSQNAGAIGSDESDKMARFLQLCDAFDLPILSLCDTPGIMVGTDAEQTAIVRHSSRVLLTGANIKVPYFTIVLRKGYGLGAMAMARGSFHLGSFFTVAWPSAEFGGMGLEGQVRLGNKAELEAIADPVARHARFQELVDKLYQHGKAVNIAPFLSIDDVIDPAASRAWVLAGLRTHGQAAVRQGKRRSHIDAW